MGVGAATAMESRRLDVTSHSPGVEKLREYLMDHVVGQGEAVEAILGAYEQYLALGMRQRPIGNFLFLGPTGVGKTKVVEAFAEALYGTSRGVVKIDCAEYQHGHEVARLIGAPPGYLGHRETRAILQQATVNQAHTDKIQVSVVLFDEVDKANDQLWTLLLGVLDKGVLSLGDGTKTDFSRALIFMTANTGAGELGKVLGRETVGFTPGGGVSEAKVAAVVTGAARRKFTPEFLNRLDEVVVFRELGAEELSRILDLEIGILQERVLATACPFALEVGAEAKERLLEVGRDPRYGARFLRKTLEHLVGEPLARAVGNGSLRKGERVKVKVGEGGLEFWEEGS